MKPKSLRQRIRWQEVAKDCNFEPHEGQKPIIDAYIKGCREILWVSGRRSGKSKCLGFICDIEAMLPNRKIWIVAPDYNLAQKVFSYLINYVSKTFTQAEYKIGTKPGMHIKFGNGTIIECKSADNANSLIGDEVDLLIIDEAAVLPPDVYDLYLFAATAMRKGITIFISTPRRKNWFFRKYNQIKNNIKEGGDDAGFVFHSPSSINPHMPREEIERARTSLPENVFKQEYEAQFLDEGAGVFRKINEAVLSNIYEEPKGDHRYVIGADIAKVNDYTVITVIDKQTHNVVYWERFNKVDWSLVVERVANASHKYNNARVTIDSTGLGNPISEFIGKRGVIVDDFKFSNKSKSEIFEKLSLFFDNESIHIPNEPILIDELNCFACELSDNGTVRYSAPLGSHDDTVCSLALAVWPLYNTKPQIPIKIKKQEIKAKPIRRTHI